MHSLVKYIVGELNKPPYNKRFNIVSFDSLSAEDLLQVLSDVLAELDVTHKVDLRIEVPEQTIVRILTFLRVLKYRPDANISPQTFRQGVLNGERHIIHPILEWLLKNNKDLQKRAYLGKYLVKLDIPSEILSDVDLYNVYEQYEVLVENFKVVHKESELIENSGVNINELRNDLTAMENERDIVVKRLEQMSRKIDNIPNKDQILRAVTQLRLEKDKKKEILTQLSDEVAALHTAQQRYSRLSQQLMEIKKATVGATPQSLMSKLEEEIKVTEFIVKEKLSKDLIQLKRQHDIYSRVSNDSYISKTSVESLSSKINMVRNQVAVLLEKQKYTQNSSNDKLVPFRQQAAIMGRKKDAILDEYRTDMNKYNALQKQVEEKQLELADAGALDMPKGSDFKDYIGKLKQRNIIYKRNRALLSGLKSETGVLQRTLDVLNTKSVQLGVPQDAEALASLSVTSSKPIPHDTDNREELLSFVAQVSTSIASHKARMLPLLDELRPLREEAANVNAEYEEVKKTHDRTSAILETGTEKLLQEVLSLRDLKQSAELERATLDAKQQIARMEIQRASGDTGQAMKEAVLAKIQDRERLAKQLKERHRQMKDSQEQSTRQKLLWSNLLRLLEVKEKALEAVKKNEGTGHKH
uniref:Intraflagellar transport protein 81 homolog n=1 Tax=Cacopsylla melanoneura TaxID=428564 RepID=A0A8D8PUS9_9HEMI